ncbi:hypothetical protein [Streptomyces sp. NPDC054784]
MFETVRRWYAWLRVRSAPPVTAPEPAPAPARAPLYVCTCRAALPYHPQEWRPAPPDTVVVDTLPLVRPYVLAHEQRERRGSRAVLTVRVPVPVPVPAYARAVAR